MDEATLISFLNGQCDENDAHLVEKWSNENADNRKKLSELRFIMGIAGSVDVMNNIDANRSFADFKNNLIKDSSSSSISTVSNSNKSIVRAKWYKQIVNIAAFFIGFIFCASLMYLWFYPSLNTSFTLSTEAGQKAQTTLPDGSKVWINSSSEITYTNSFWSSDRYVNLIGEAYFEVAPQDGNKFIVVSNDVETTVLGTKFNVRTKPNETKIVTTLFEGSVRVRLNSKQGDRGCVLIPGETVEVDTKTGDIALKKYETPSNVLLWMGGCFKFNQKSLGEITQILENLFDIEFVFADENIINETFTGSFSTDSTPEKILNILQYTNYFNYTVNGNVIYIYK